MVTSSNYKVIFGMSEEKYKTKGKNQFLSNGLNHLLIFFWQKPPTDSFKILKREIVFDDANFLPRLHFEAYIKHQLNRKFIGYCQVAYCKRYAGTSNHSFMKKIRLFLLFTSHYYVNNGKMTHTFSIADPFNLY